MVHSNRWTSLIVIYQDGLSLNLNVEPKTIQFDKNCRNTKRTGHFTQITGVRVRVKLNFTTP